MMEDYSEYVEPKPIEERSLDDIQLIISDHALLIARAERCFQVYCEGRKVHQYGRSVTIEFLADFQAGVSFTCTTTYRRCGEEFSTDYLLPLSLLKMSDAEIKAYGAERLAEEKKAEAEAELVAAEKYKKEQAAKERAEYERLKAKLEPKT